MIYTGGYSMGFVDSPLREIALLVYTGTSSQKYFLQCRVNKVQ
jgi:hypothetical protein